MSRIRVFGLNGRSKGEFAGRISRGWAIAGSADVTGGGETTVEISTEIADKPWLQLGRMVLVEKDPLPAWAGIIDPEWAGYGMPVLSVYNIEYLLNLRAPDDPRVIHGTTAAIIGELIEIANKQEETFLRLGATDKDPARDEEIDRRPLWEQMQEIVGRSGMEATFRPRVVDGKLFVYVDVKKKTGKTTNFLYHDGDEANMAVRSANISQEFWNRVIGINDASNEEERLVTDPFIDATSKNLYRLRSRSVQFAGITEQSELDAAAKQYLAAYGKPRLELTVAVRDDGDAFRMAALGNSAIFHASNVRLPGGKHGWRGEARIMAMAYDEPSNTLGMTVVAQL